MYVFFTRRADRGRVLYFDRDGYVLVTKRLERGSYRVPWVSKEAALGSDFTALDATRMPVLDADQNGRE